MAALAVAGSLAEAQPWCNVDISVGRSSGPNMRWAVHDASNDAPQQLASQGEGWGDGRATTALAWGDFDGDGRLELIVGRNPGPNMRWAVFDDAQAGFELLHEGGVGWGDSRGVTAIAAGDVDGDGRDEIIIGRNAGSSMRWAVYDDAQAAFELLHEGGVGWGDSRGVTAIAAGDVDGDGRDEIIVGRNAGGSMRWAVYDDAQAGFVLRHEEGIGWGNNRGVTAIAVGDVDGDERDEVVIGRNAGGNMRWAVYDDAEADFVLRHEDGIGWGNGRAVTALAVGDVDGDGRDEIIIGRNAGSNMRWAVHDDAQAVFVLRHEDGIGWGNGRAVTALAVGDVDGDGMAELAVGRSSGPNMRWAVHADATAGFSQRFSAGQGWGDTRATAALAFATSRRANRDSDGDGLPDLWETHGLDVDCDGIVDLDLAERGADPHRKDLFVEIDYMELHKPLPEAMEALTDAFAAAPVDNPDGTTGVSLWLLVDEEIPHQDDITTWDDFTTLRNNRFGTAAQRSAPNAEAILAAKSLVYRFAVFAHRRDGGRSSGRCCGDGNDIVVTLGASGWGIDPLTGHTVGTREEQAGTLMHELGHALGLRHGGGDRSNCKPNYISVMNYGFQTAWISNRDAPTQRLDYSREVLDDLDESQLDESVGIDDGADQTQWSPDDGTTSLTGWGDGPLDWDGTPAFPDPAPVAVDVNNRSIVGCGLDSDSSDAPSPGEILVGFNDWSNLSLHLRGAGAAADRDDNPQELTPDAARQLRACAANDSSPRCRPLGFEYVAKLICGRQSERDSLRLARGFYTSAVNIHNPHNRDVRFYIKVALGFPPGDLRPGVQYKLGEGELRYDDVITADCELVRQALFKGNLPHSWVEGMFVLQTTDQVDVRAVYSTAALTTDGTVGAHSSLEVVEVAERRTARAHPKQQADLIPLPALPPPPFLAEVNVQLPIGMPGTLYCAETPPTGGPSRSVRVLVRNEGLGEANASMTRVDFHEHGSVSKVTPALAAGSETMIDFDIPSGCYGRGFSSSCAFTIQVDQGEMIQESDEENNAVSSHCLAPAG